MVQDGHDNELEIQLRELCLTQSVFPIKYSFLDVQSPGLARNNGLGHATGTWICFWDSDDEGEVNNVYNAVTSADSHVNVIVGAYSVAYTDMRGNEVKKIAKESSLYGVFRELAWWRIVFRSRRLEDRKFQAWRMGEDQAFVMELNIKSSEILFCSDTFYTYYSGRRGQLTQNEGARRELIPCLDYMINWLVEEEVPGSVSASIVRRQIITLCKNYPSQLSVVLKRLIFQSKSNAGFSAPIRILNLIRTLASRKLDED